MPTMSKLFAAFFLGALGYFAADTVALHLPEEVRPGMLRPLSAFFGLLVGWRFLGKRVGHGMQSAIGMGLSASVLLVLICLLFFSGNEMLRRALRKSYGGNPFEALQDMVQIALDFTEYLLQADVIAVLVLGGIAVGMIVELVARRWS